MGAATTPLGLRGVGPSAAGAIEITLKDGIRAGDAVSVSIARVTNPPGVDVTDFKVYTTSNPTAGVSAPYTIDTVAESLASNRGCLPYSTTCYSPQAFRTAYGITSLLAKGIDGKGRTILMPDPVEVPSAQDASNIFQDLSAYDSYFHLPPVQLTVVPGTAAKASADLAGGEEVEDVEMAHAIAPGAAIRVVLGNFNSNLGSVGVRDLESLLAASKGADVLSASWGVPEACFSPAQLAEARSVFGQLAARHITVTAGAGDWGRTRWTCANQAKATPKMGVYWPASDPLVLAVGGTTLSANPNTGTYISEVAWNDPQQDQTSGGGFSSVFPRPAYQQGVAGIAASRGVPDVAGDASYSYGLAGIGELSDGDQPTLYSLNGTSAAAPFWAGVIALADQYAGRDLGFVNPAIYRIAQSPQYHSAFHDITEGNNTISVAGKQVEGYHAGPGWDPVTGWGTPVVSVLLPLLGRYDAS
jgi:subtilase family serine protease